MVPPLKPDDDGARALAWMEDFKVSHLPVVDGHEYLGLVSEQVILDANDNTLPVTAYLQESLKPAVTDEQHIYDVLRAVTSHEVTLIPVLEANGDFIGSITLQELLSKFEKLAAISQAGGIIVLEFEKKDYSLAKVAHVIESNDSKILSSYISNGDSSGKVELTMKIDREELAPVIQSLERHEFNVIGFFQEKAQLDDLRNRYDSFMRYMNI